MGKKRKGKRTTPKKVQVTPEEYARLLARAGTAWLEAFNCAVAHAFIDAESAETLEGVLIPVVQAEVINASVYAATN